MSRLERALVGLGLAAATTLAMAVALRALGSDPLAVALALVRGALLEADGVEATLRRATPLLLCGLAVALAFRAGAWNLGAEGQLAAGALAATWVGVGAPSRALGPGSPALLALALALAALAGAAWGALAAWLRERRGVPDVLATIFLNFIALALVAFAIDEGGPLREAAGGYPRSDELAPGAALPWVRVRALDLRFHLGLPLAFACTLVVLFFLERTAAGVGIRVTGERRAVAEAVGFRAGALVALALVLGGALAGLAGAVEVTGVTHRLFRQVSGGLGYTAVAVALIGRLRPLGVAAAALGFGALEAGAVAAQRRAGVSPVLAQALEGVVLLAVLAHGPIVAAIEARSGRRAPASGPAAGGGPTGGGGGARSPSRGGSGGRQPPGDGTE